MRARAEAKKRETEGIAGENGMQIGADSQAYVPDAMFHREHECRDNVSFSRRMGYAPLAEK